MRLSVNYQNVNKYTVPDVLPLEVIYEVIQRVGKAKYISLFDARSGYNQLTVKLGLRDLSVILVSLSTLIVVRLE